MARRIYLDHAATTPMRPEAIAAVAEGMACWANPSSPHAEGRAARAALEDARERIKAALGWDGELIFTSGASEALTIALARAKGGRRLVSAVEHEAVFRAAGPEAKVLPIRGGEVEGETLLASLAGSAGSIVAIQHVNSETGIMQPLDRLAPMVRDAGGLLLADCSQSAGKYPLPDADMIVVSGHKLGGPPGIGALLIRDLNLLEPVGGQEFGYRSGTENLPGALGFAAALDTVTWVDDPVAGSSDVVRSAAWLSLTQGLAYCVLDLEYPILLAGGDWAGEGTHSVSICAFTMPHLSAAAQLIRFDAMGFALSAGSACSSGTLKSSRALRAFGMDEDAASRTIRVSFGWNTTAEDVADFGDAWLQLAAEARARAA